MAKLIECPTCKKKISIDAESCPNCGQPISDEIKKKILDKEKENKKNTRIGCLIVLIGIAIYTIYSVSTSPDKYFAFSKEQFLEKFVARTNQPSIKSKGNIILTQAKSDDKNISVYNLNNDGILQIIDNEDGKGIWKICVKYDDDQPYDESTILNSSLAAILAVADLGYLNVFDFKEPYEYLRTKVMSNPRNKRGSISDKAYANKTTKIDISPVWRSICLESLEEHK